MCVCVCVCACVRACVHACVHMKCVEVYLSGILISNSCSEGGRKEEERIQVSRQARK